MDAEENESQAKQELLEEFEKRKKVCVLGIVKYVDIYVDWLLFENLYISILFMFIKINYFIIIKYILLLLLLNRPNDKEGLPNISYLPLQFLL